MSRIFVLNPNSSTEITAAMSACLEPLRLISDHAIDCTELTQAPIGIETDADVALAASLVRERIPEERCDAAVIGCFSDPGLAETRARSKFPVFGIAESAYCSALMLGSRFGVISLGPSSIARHDRQIEAHGLTGRRAGDRSVCMNVAEGNSAGSFDKIARTGELLRDQDGADVVILGCAGMGGHRVSLQERLGLPVVDPVQAAVAVAIAALDLGYHTFTESERPTASLKKPVFRAT